MKTTNGKMIKKLVLITLFLLFLQGVSAVSLSINPANIDIDDMRRGGYAEAEIRVATNSEEDLRILRFMDPNSTLEDWLTFEPNVTDFTISQDNDFILKVIIQPPESIPNGEYSDMIRFRVLAKEAFQGQTGSVIEVGVSAQLNFEISDTEIQKCTILSSDIQNVEKGDDVPIDFRIINNGNVMLTPTVKLDVWNKDQTAVLKTETFRNFQVLPTVRDDFTVLLDTLDLSTDQYFADITVEECDYENTLTFDVLVPGAVTTSGRLIKIQNKVWNNVNDNIETKAVFENNGEKGVSAVFRGKIFLDNTLIEEFESGFKTVSIGSVEDFPIIFTPEKPGRYVVKGRVYYNDKQSFEKTSIINVNPEGVNYDGTTKDIQGTNSSYTLLILIGIILVVLILLILIKKKRLR